MEKDAIVEEHEKFLILREQLEQVDDIPQNAFSEYEKLGVSPRDRPHQWSKDEHREAIFRLLQGIMQHVSDEELDDADSLRQRMDELAEQVS